MSKDLPEKDDAWEYLGRGVKEWIEDRYGPINIDDHGAYVIASVPLFNPGSAAVGVGPAQDIAILNLYRYLRANV